ncbi:Peptidyl-prolyl cis-trans isomerase FKBP12 [Lamellibrachia satsuma]|nr:Peptidyl-prolyl cis-trans isomerase FKBP12 [Lamellibrachia satsuma]
MNVSEGVTKEILREGSGPQVLKGDNITVQCTGSIAEGNKKFWSTKDPGQKPFSFQAGMKKVIAGWDEGCLTMKKGEVAKLTIAGHKGYGDRGFSAWGIPPNATLIFEIEVL